MRENLGYLKVSSIVIKVVAWIFLSLGLISGVTLLLGKVPGSPRWSGLIVMVFYSFVFFFFFLVAKMADLLMKIAKEVRKEV